MLNSKLALLCLVGSLLLGGTAHAQTFLTDETVTIARHDKRQSRVQFNRDADEADPDRFATVFSPTEAKQRELTRPDLLRYNELPACSTSEVQLYEVFEHTPITDYFDVVYFDSDDPKQVEKAKQYGTTAVPYNPALMVDPKTKAADFWQDFARFVQIPCLPTRFRFVNSAGKRYQEYRLGNSAWEAPPPAGTARSR